MKKRMGRPTLYKPEYCDLIVEHCTEGFSVESFAGRIGVCVDTVTHWGNVHPDFSAALKDARARSLFWWENIGKQGMLGETKGKFNAAIWIFNMKNRFKWRDVLEHVSESSPSRGKLSFKDFCESCGYPPPYEKQNEMRDFVFTPDKPRLLLGARGYGKTDYAVVLGCAYELYLNPLETSVLLVTKSPERNASIVREIAAAALKHGITFDVQNAQNLRVKGLIGKDNSISALTVGASTFRGRHPKLVIMDDPVTPEDSREAVRKRVQSVYEELTKVCSNIVIIGQPVHKFDLYETLRPIVKKLELPHGLIPELDHDLEAQRLAGVSEESIQASYFLNVKSDQTNPFDQIRYTDVFPAGDSVAFIDPSFEGGDFTALSIGKAHFDGVAIQGYCYKKAWYHCIDDMVARIKEHNVRRLCFETNALGEQPIIMLRTALPGIGVVGRKSTNNKHSRIMAAGAFAHLIHLSKKSDRTYIDQVVKYEYGSEFDDAPDSLASLLAWIGLIKGKENVR